MCKVIVLKLIEYFSALLICIAVCRQSLVLVFSKNNVQDELLTWKKQIFD